MILFFYAIPAAFLAYMLPQQQSVFWIEDANIQLIPLHMHFASDPTWGQAVVGEIDFDATVQIHTPLAILVVAKRFQGKRQQGWFFFGKHGGDLSFRGAMNAGIGTACLPTIQIGLGLLQALKAFPLERSLGVADTRFNFSFSIWILDPTRQSDGAIVRQNVAIEGIQNGIIDVRDEHTLAQIIQDDDPRSAAESTECFLM